jgi:branched-chain amino acid transport system permease protein
MPIKYIIIGIILATYACIPAVVPENMLHLMAITGIWIIIASGLNLLTGYMGYVSFGHAGFVGLGAYIGVLLSRHFDFSFWLAAIVTPVLIALIGILLGAILLRLSGIYFSIGTLLVGEILHSTFYNWSKVTGGYMGLNVPGISLRIPGVMVLDFEVIHWYYLIHLVLLLVICFIAFLIKSQFGKELIAIKENESLAESLGVDVQARKRQCFALACMLAGFGGVLFAYYIRHIDPGSFAIGASAEFLTIVIIGGLASLIGPFLGSYLLKTLTLYLGALGAWRMVVYGMIIVLVMLYARGGIAGLGQFVLNREKKK